MEVGRIILAIPIVLLTLIIVIGTVIRFVKSFNHIYEPEKHSRWATIHYTITIIVFYVVSVAASPENRLHRQYLMTK